MLWLLGLIGLGCALICYGAVRAGRRADEQSQRALDRWRLEEIAREKTIHGMRKAWLEYSGEVWLGTFEELKLHISNLKERLDD